MIRNAACRNGNGNGGAGIISRSNRSAECVDDRGIVFTWPIKTIEKEATLKIAKAIKENDGGAQGGHPMRDGSWLDV